MIARSTVMIAAAISETGPAATASLLSSQAETGDVGAVLAELGDRLLGGRLGARVVRQLARVVADRVEQVAHEIGQFLAPGGGVRVGRRLADHLRGAGGRPLGQRPDVHVAATDYVAPMLGFPCHCCSPPCLESD